MKTDIFPELEEKKEVSNEKQRRKICYCRVSTRSQKEDLERQVQFFQGEYPGYEIIKDIGSGLNSKRKGFNSILDSGIKGDLEEVVVTHRDRFCRFDFDIFERIIQEYSGEKSWFSIKQKLPLKKNLSTTCSQSLRFSPQESMVSEVGELKGKSKNKLVRTLKIRIFPDETEKSKLNLMFEQFRWYYNAMVNIFYLHDIEKQQKYSMYSMRDLLMNHRYKEETEGNLIFTEFVFDKNVNKFPVPEWLEDKGVHNRLSRGAVCKFVSSLNSAVSNVKNGNIKNFRMEFKTKKEHSNYIHFEDKQYPSFIRKIKSRYWFTTPDRRRINIPYSKIFEENKKGLEVIYEKETNRYFIHCPVDRNWFPEEDKRSSENQAKHLSSNGNQVIALDPGIRKFLVGYDSNGKISFIGEGACNKLTKLLLEVDQIKSRKKKLRRWRKIKNLI